MLVEFKSTVNIDFSTLTGSSYVFMIKVLSLQILIIVASIGMLRGNPLGWWLGILYILILIFGGIYLILTMNSGLTRLAFLTVIGIYLFMPNVLKFFKINIQSHKNRLFLMITVAFLYQIIIIKIW